MRWVMTWTDGYVPLEVDATHPATEWLRSTSDTPGGTNGTCTFQGNGDSHHLAWSVPMYQPTYFTPSVFIHSFVMFAPFLATPGLHAKVSTTPTPLQPIPGHL